MAHHHKYQPERVDILWNTYWGLPADAVTADQARERGLVLWKERWVTEEEMSILKKQYNAYRIVHQIYLLLIVSSAYSILLPVLLFNRWLYTTLPMPEGAPVGHFLLLVLILALFQTVLAWGLFKFKDWAYFLGFLVLLGALFLSLAYLFMSTAIHLAQLVPGLYAGTVWGLLLAGLGITWSPIWWVGALIFFSMPSVKHIFLTSGQTLSKTPSETKRVADEAGLRAGLVEAQEMGAEESKCPHCGEGMAADAAKCPYCAEDIQPEMMRCPFCAEEIRVGAKKCKHCGEWLEKLASDRSPDALPSEKKCERRSVEEIAREVNLDPAVVEDMVSGVDSQRVKDFKYLVGPERFDRMHGRVITMYGEGKGLKERSPQELDKEITQIAIQYGLSYHALKDILSGKSTKGDFCQRELFDKYSLLSG